jgi:hypothetical protein
VTGPDDDPSDRETRMTEIVDEDSRQALEHAPAAIGDEAPRPWYRNRILLALWALMVALLLTLIVYGIVELSRGGGETTVPTTTTTTTPSTTTSPSSTTTTEAPPTETTEPPPPPETTEQSPEEAPPPPPPNTSAPTSPPKHHHHWHLPHFS